MAPSRRCPAHGTLAGLAIAGLAAAWILLAAAATAATNAERFQYLSPVPGSERVSPWNHVAIRDGRVLDPLALASATVSVVGETSGAHEGAVALSRDGRTFFFTPASPFTLGERVTVSAAGLRAASGEPLPPLAFDFTVAPVDPGAQAHAWLEDLGAEAVDGSAPAADLESPALDLGPASPDDETAAPDGSACSPLPSGYPTLTVIRSKNPEPGHVFLTPFRTTPPGHLMIVDNLGQPIFYRRTATSSHDLCVQPDGRLTYFDRTPPGGERPGYFAMDSAYAVVDSFAAGNGYVTDSHELLLLDDGHALLMIYDPQPVRMDLVVPGGNPNAIVVGLVIQELDEDKQVVFQWRSWDHFAITDLASPTQSLLSGRIDYVHGNAIDVDHDGHLLLSSRHMNEITKIHRSTGAILWRWGLRSRHNDFTFTNDTRGFSHQHHVRRLPNGHVTLFDNGNFLAPQYSRALEYALDEEAMTATLVWSYGTVPATYSPFLGSVQRRAGGGTMIGFGGASGSPKVVDLNAEGGETLALGLATPVWTYRAYRFPWRTTLFTTDVEAIAFGEVGLGSAMTRSVTIRNPSSAPLEVGCVLTTHAAFSVDVTLPLVLAPGAEATVPVTFRPGALTRYDARLYARRITDTEVIAQDVALSGEGVVNAPPDCSAARASVESLWPAQHQLVPVTIEGVTDPDGDPIAIAIGAILQDEPVSDLGDGAACPDAAVDGGVAMLRAERSARGNGRAIHVSFEAYDGRGGVCAGTVVVCVPHDQGEGGETQCVDDGALYDALGVCPAPGRRGVATEPEAVVAPALSPLGAAGAQATVAFALPQAADVTLALFDLSGRRVRTLERGPRAAGEHRLTWSTAGLSPGVYFYRLRTAAGVSLTRPVPVVR